MGIHYSAARLQIRPKGMSYGMPFGYTFFHRLTQIYLQSKSPRIPLMQASPVDSSKVLSLPPGCAQPFWNVERDAPGQNRIVSGCVESAFRSSYAKEAAHEGWQVIYQITCQYNLRPESIRLSGCMLYVPSWAASFALVLLCGWVATRNHPILSRGIPLHIPERRPPSPSKPPESSIGCSPKLPGQYPGKIRVHDRSAVSFPYILSAPLSGPLLPPHPDGW